MLDMFDGNNAKIKVEMMLKDKVLPSALTLCIQNQANKNI